MTRLSCKVRLCMLILSHTLIAWSAESAAGDEIRNWGGFMAPYQSEIGIGPKVTGHIGSIEENHILLSGDCADYVDLSSMPLPISVTGTTSGATNDYGPYPSQPACWQGPYELENSAAGPDVTYKWVVPADSIYTLSLLNSAYDTGLEIYAFTCPAEPVYPDDFICGNDDYSNFRSLVRTRFNEGDTLLIVVDGYGQNMGNFQLEISYYALPGDNCASYVDLSGRPLPINVSGVTIDAINNYSLDSIAPACWQYDYDPYCADGPDIIYKWTAPQTADYAFELLANEFDASIQLYEFTCPEEPIFPDNFICGNDDYSDDFYEEFSFLENIRLEEDQEILIAIDAAADISGSFSLAIIPMQGQGPRNVCSEHTLYGQTASIATDLWEARFSDRHIGPPITIFDNIPDVHGTVCGIDFMGFDLILNEGLFQEADEDSMSFLVKFYADDLEGQPGELLYSFAVIPEKTEIGQFSNMTLNYYHGLLEECYAIDGGWLSIQGLSIGLPEDCFFLWLSSQDGDALCYQGGSSPSFPNYFSMNFCLLDSTVTAIANDQKELPLEITLGQNYPNPFNSQTTIQFEIFSGERTTIDIFDLTGKKITTLIDEFRDAGLYEISWNAENVSSGAYFYRLKSGGHQEVKKMVLLK